MNFYDLMLAESIGGSGGGGETSPLTLLNTITVSEDVRAVNIDFTPFNNLYDVLLVFEDLSLSANDFLYYVKNGSSPSGGSYSNQSINHHKGISYWKIDVPGGVNPITYACVSAATTGYAAAAELVNNLYIYCYSGAKKIKSGSIIKIYGGKYADM